MATIAPRPDPGVIELALAGLAPKQRMRVKALALREAFAALPEGQRVMFTQDGITVEILDPPDVHRDREGNIVGLRVRVRAREAGGGPVLPLTDGVHQVVNPPVKVPNGTVHLEADPQSGAEIEIDNYEERPVTALKDWLVASVKHEARQNGWPG